MYNLSRLITNDGNKAILSGCFVPWNRVMSLSGGFKMVRIFCHSSLESWSLFSLALDLCCPCDYLPQEWGGSDIIPITGIPFKREGDVCFFPLFLGILSLETQLLWHEKPKPQRMAMCCHSSPTELLANSQYHLPAMWVNQLWHSPQMKLPDDHNPRHHHTEQKTTQLSPGSTNNHKR